MQKPDNFRWGIGDKVRKVRGSAWRGTICGFYCTPHTPEGYCVASSFEPGSVQVWPAAALESWEPNPNPTPAEILAELTPDPIGYTVFIMEESREGTTFITHIPDDDLASAKAKALEECEKCWGPVAVENTTVVGVIRGNVEPIEWDECD